jgi:hypothetical protein
MTILKQALNEAELDQVTGGNGARVIKEPKSERDRGETPVELIITPRGKVITPGNVRD